MLAKGTSDPYTRFITPEEFESMRKYDVTGVGLHLGTAEEFVRKTGLQLPAGHDESEVRSFAARTHVEIQGRSCRLVRTTGLRLPAGHDVMEAGSFAACTHAEI